MINLKCLLIVSCAAFAIAGCSTSPSQMEKLHDRITLAEDVAQRAHQRSEAAYAMSETATYKANLAEQTSAESAERALRMLEKSIQK